MARNFLIVCTILYPVILIAATPIDQIDVCSQAIECGPCFGYIAKFGYNSEQKKCVQFTYGGCSGNKNNFDTLEDCKSVCEACSQPIEAGPCFGYNLKFGYNSKQKKCVQFTYGGCSGNKNNFDTEEDCQSACEEKPSSQVQQETEASA